MPPRRDPVARGSAAGAGATDRVVMLVDNDVVRDSRVQKQARSMAEAGWDVVLLGKAPGKAAGKAPASAAAQGARKGAAGKNAAPRRWRIGEARVRLLTVPTDGVFRPGDLTRARWRDPLAYPRLRDARARAGSPSRLVALRVRRTERLVEKRRTGAGRLDRVRVALLRRALGDRAWRRLDPHILDFDAAYGPVIDELRPALIHANDFRMLGVGARAVERARAEGRDVTLVWDAHEFLPGAKPWNDQPHWHLAQVLHERQYARSADAVVTVSDELAELLQHEHHLPRVPTTVLNAPYRADDAVDAPSLREVVGARPGQRVLVYSGVAAPQRGLDTMVEALPRLPEDVLCAFVVASAETEHVRALQAKADRLGVADRVRTAPYVPFDQVVPYLASADVGVIPIHHWPNHEIALITKFFEYSHARLPLLVSDVRAMSAAVRRTGQGEVFTAEDVDSFVAAARRLLADPQRYRAAYDDPALLEGWTWEAQARRLDAVYRDVLAGREPGSSLERPTPQTPGRT